MTINVDRMRRANVRRRAAHTRRRVHALLQRIRDEARRDERCRVGSDAQ